MGDPPLNHRQNAQAQAQARTNKQNARAISHRRPSSIGRKPSCVCPSSEGSRQNPDTRHDNSLAQLHSQSYSIFSSNILPSLFAIDRPTDSTASSCLQAATLPPKDTREREKKTHLRFRSHADGLASLEHPSTPVATSGPAQSIPTLLDYRQKDPFFSPRHTVKQEHSTSPKTRIHSHTSRLPDHRLASLPMLEPRLVGNISWCAHRCDVRIHTSSTANGLEGCHSSLMQKQASHLQYVQPLPVCIASLVIHLIF